MNYLDPVNLTICAFLVGCIMVLHWLWRVTR